VPVAEEEGISITLEFGKRGIRCRRRGRHVYRPQAGAFGDGRVRRRVERQERLDLHRTAAVLVDRFGEFGGTDVVLVTFVPEWPNLDRHGSGFGSRPQGNQPEISEQDKAYSSRSPPCFDFSFRTGPMIE